MADPVREAASVADVLRLYCEWEDSPHGALMLTKPLSHYEAFAAGYRAALSRPAADAEAVASSGPNSPGAVYAACHRALQLPPASAGSKVETAADPRMVNSEGEPFGPLLVKILRDEAECLDDPVGFDDRCRIAGVLAQAADYIEASMLAAERAAKGGERG